MKHLYRIIIYLSFVFVVSCSNATDCYDNLYMNVTNYEIYEPTYYTPNRNISVYTNFDIDLDLIDAIVDSTEECLGMKLNQTCFMVYVPDDWYVSDCTGQQLFPCNINEANGFDVCKVKKGLNPTESCPCNCRATIQDENIIITTPNLLIFGQELIRMMSGENNVYLREETRRCVFNLLWETQ